MPGAVLGLGTPWHNGEHRAGCGGGPRRRVSKGEKERERWSSTAPAGHIPTGKGLLGWQQAQPAQDHAQGGWGGRSRLGGWQHPPTAREKPQQQHAGALGVVVQSWLQSCKPWGAAPMGKVGEKRGEAAQPRGAGTLHGDPPGISCQPPPKARGCSQSPVNRQGTVYWGDSPGLGLED